MHDVITFVTMFTTFIVDMTSILSVFIIAANGVQAILEVYQSNNVMME